MVTGNLRLRPCPCIIFRPASVGRSLWYTYTLLISGLPRAPPPPFSLFPLRLGDFFFSRMPKRHLIRSRLLVHVLAADFSSPLTFRLLRRTFPPVLLMRSVVFQFFPTPSSWFGEFTLVFVIFSKSSLKRGPRLPQIRGLKVCGVECEVVIHPRSLAIDVDNNVQSRPCPSGLFFSPDVSVSSCADAVWLWTRRKLEFGADPFFGSLARRECVPGPVVFFTIFGPPPGSSVVLICGDCLLYDCGFLRSHFPFQFSFAGRVPLEIVS